MEVTVHHDVHFNNDDIKLLATLGGAALAAILTDRQQQPQWVTDLLAAITRLETKMAKVDDRITAFVADITPKLDALSTSADASAASLKNIAADEANIKAQLDAALAAAGGDLSADSQAALQAVSDRLGTQVTALQGVATDAQALADSVPDVPTPPAG